MSENSVSVIFRVDEDLKNAFERAAKAQDLTVSQLLRRFMRHQVELYAKNHAQGDLIAITEPPKATPKASPSPKKQKPTVEGKKALLGMFKVK